MKGINAKNKTQNKLLRSKGKIYHRTAYTIIKQRVSFKHLSIVIGIKQSKVFRSFFYIVKYTNNIFTLVKPIYGLFILDFIKSLVLNLRTFSYCVLGCKIILKYLIKNLKCSNIYPSNQTKPIYIKSSGTFGILIEKNIDLGLALIRLPTGLSKFFFLNSFAILGRNSNIYRKSIIYGKAGVTKYFKNKSIVRGVAMNPVDHPHGGRTKTNSPEVNI